jgi:hypothetical protein
MTATRLADDSTASIHAITQSADVASCELSGRELGGGRLGVWTTGRGNRASGMPAFAVLALTCALGSACSTSTRVFGSDEAGGASGQGGEDRGLDASAGRTVQGNAGQDEGQLRPEAGASGSAGQSNTDAGAVSGGTGQSNTDAGAVSGTGQSNTDAGAVSGGTGQSNTDAGAVSGSAGQSNTGGEGEGADSGGGAASGLSRGTTCNAGIDCADRHCVDGVCCESECAGKCQACVSSKTGRADGTCWAVQVGTDPDSECEAESAPCGHDGMCDGNGACRFQASSTVCGEETCTAKKYTAAARCDGSGACLTPTALDCANCEANTCHDTCTSTPDCSSGFYCVNSLCVAKKVNGAECQTAGECSSNSCIEGVCCDGTCAQPCSSCLQAKTGRSDGTCAYVKAGTAHGTDCVTQPASTCGYDGTCDGNGGCHFYAAGTQCDSATCADDTTRSASSACDGSGTCEPQQTSSCGNYACENGTCRTSCASSTQCSRSTYCSGSSCIDRKEPGATCSRADECSSNSCGGRCCNDAQACNCPAPQAENLLKNPGFDDLSGWTVTTGPIEYSLRRGAIGNDSDLDYDGDPTYNYEATDCPFSSALVGLNPAGSLGTAEANRVSQCVALSSPNTEYYFGANYIWGLVNFGVDLYSSTDCSGTPASTTSGAGAQKMGWRATNGLIQSQNYKSVRLSIYTEGTSFILDQAFVTKAPAIWY